MVEALKPDYVAPLVAFLGHHDNATTGAVFECGSGWVSAVRWQRTAGVSFPVDRPLEPEHIAAKWNEITNFENGKATYPTSTQDSFLPIHANFVNVGGRQGSGNASPAASKSSVDVAAAQKQVFNAGAFEYTEQDVILYALGLGAKRTDLPLVYESDPKFFTLPTFGVVPGLNAVNSVPFGDFLPSFNPMMLLHGEQYLEVHKPIPQSGKLVSKARVVDILDKGKAAAVIIGVDTMDASGNKLFYSESTLFIRGIGGFGGKKSSDRGAATASNDPPNRPADAIISEKTSTDQAALYRLSGDYNPLHIDPEMSKMGGFDVPILHGLCTYGIAGKHVLKTYCNNDPSKFKSIKVRFFVSFAVSHLRVLTFLFCLRRPALPSTSSQAKPSKPTCGRKAPK